MTKTTLSTLPALDSSYSVSPEALKGYGQNGHAILRNICSGDEIAAHRHAINEAVAERRSQIEELPLAERDTYGKAFLQIMNLWTDNESVARFSLGRRFAGIAASLMGVDRVRLYHDQALYKESGGGFTPWHQDQHYWPLDTDACITMWMPLVDVTPNMGTLNFASGSGESGYLGDIPISDSSESIYEEYCRDKGYPIVNHGAMNAGDATFHSGWCIHGAPGNNSEVRREVMTVIFYADNMNVIPEGSDRWNQNRKNDLADWLPGCRPGGPAVSKLNPLVYEA